MFEPTLDCPGVTLVKHITELKWHILGRMRCEVTARENHYPVIEKKIKIKLNKYFSKCRVLFVLAFFSSCLA